MPSPTLNYTAKSLGISEIETRTSRKSERLRREIDGLRESQSDAAVGAGFESCAEEAACAISDGKGVMKAER